jgi:hypothetical protein
VFSLDVPSYSVCRNSCAVTQPVPLFPGILPIPPLDSVKILVVVFLLIATIVVVPLLISLSLLRAHPFNLGLLVVMCTSVNFPVKAQMFMMGRPLSLCGYFPCSRVIWLCCSSYLYLSRGVYPGYHLPHMPYIIRCM